ncbi:hypothetical protein [Streptosporangium sp. NPDC000239]|uniref:hypothetical protein n=1 Tax=unclassified Streptosporangium TaxID=2632669 RepID=UPI00331DB750
MRRTISAVLVVLGCVCAPLALVGFWMADRAVGTGRYVETVDPLAENSTIQDDVADRVTAAIAEPMRELDTSVPDHTARMAVDKVVTGDRFPEIWRWANQVAHRRMSGDPQGGNLVLDLTPVYEMAKGELEHEGVPAATRLPALHPEIELLSATDLVRVVTVRDILVPWRWATLSLSIVLLAVGTALAGDRLCALVGVGLGLAGGMTVLAVLLVVVRDTALSDVTDDGAQGRVFVTVFDALTRSLWTGLRVLFAVGLVVAAVAFAVRHVRSSPAGGARPPGGGSGSPGGGAREGRG